VLKNPLPDIDIKALVIFAVSLFILRKWKTDPVYVMLGTAVAGVIVYKVL
jgi:chromate transporter